MARRIAVILLLALALCIILGSVLLLTPAGNQTLVTTGVIAPTNTPTPKPFTPSPLPSPTRIPTVRGTPPVTTATADYLLDADTQHTLVDINAEKPAPMTSTTKIMTALIAIQTGNRDPVVTIKQDASEEV